MSERASEHDSHAIACMSKSAYRSSVGKCSSHGSSTRLRLLRACVRACVRDCVHACVYVCVCVSTGEKPRPSVSCHTEVDSVHSNRCSILAVPLLVQQHGGRSTGHRRRMESIEVTHVGPELFHCSSTECITGCNQDTEVIV